jgi:E3 ubiquitin-protein ligase AIP2
MISQLEGFLFEGQLTVDPEPPRPTWMVAQNVLAALASEQDLRSRANLGQTSGAELPQLAELLTPEMQELMQRVNGINDFGPELEQVIEASLQVILLFLNIFLYAFFDFLSD